MNRRKLHLIGIDAAPLWLIHKLSRFKGMENFRKLLTAGLISEMESTLPPMTGAAWPSIYTGLPPGEHGVPDFFEMRKDYTPDLAEYDSVSCPPFWKNIADSGFRCLIITPAMETRLPGYRNIDLITGFPLKAKTESSFLRRLMKKHGFYGEPEIEKDMKEGRMDVEEGAAIFTKSVHDRAELAMEAIGSEKYDFTYVCFTETDRIQHFVMNMKEMERLLLPIYMEIDKYIGFVMERAGRRGEGIIIVSDHGAQPIKEKFLINSWLLEKGYITLKSRQSEDGTEKGRLPYELREMLLKTGLRKTYDRLPHAAKRAVFSSAGRLFSGGGGRYARMHLFDFNMEKTKAFAAISNINVCTIWINDKRFEQGFVDDTEKEKIKRVLKAELQKLRDPEGKKLIVSVYDAQEYYKGTRKFMAPDLFAEAGEGYTIDIFNFSESSRFMKPEAPKRGDHTRQGIFGCYPKGLARGNRLGILDIAEFISKNYRR